MAGTATQSAVRTSTVTVAAPAKVNLHLHVVGRRADGYHLLDSLVVFPGIGDVVTVQAADALSLTVDGPFAAALAEEPDNLVLRAARALAAHCDVDAGAEIRLTKNLPIASGIGGGSADAAATLRALIRLWGVDPGGGALHDLALGLGADVPMCLAGRAVAVGGIGEEMAEAPSLPPVWLVLANPGVALPTPAVFKRRLGAFSNPAPLTARPRDAFDLAGALSLRRNDLTDAAIGLEPAVGECLRVLGRLPSCLLARMSGSGATCFALFAERELAETAAAVLAERHPDWWIRAGIFVSG